MWRTFKELLPLVIKGWWIWAIGGLAGITGLMLDLFTDLGFPWWVWVSLAVVALVAALVRAFHLMRAERDAYRPDPQSIGQWPVREAVRYLLNDSQWGVRQVDDSAAYDNVFPHIREAALNGLIVVWGRRPRDVLSEHEPRIPIEREYWGDFTFDELRCMPADYGDEDVITKTRRDRGPDQSDDRIYEELLLVRSQVRSHWPKAFLVPRRLKWNCHGFGVSDFGRL